MTDELPSCCRKDVGVSKGIIYGLIPHAGCILFIIASILGSTILMQFFKPLLMNKNIFYYMIAISLGFSTLSSVMYLKKNRLLSLKGVMSKKKYLSLMYGMTIGINLLLFFVVFPAAVNFGGISGEVVDDSSLLKLSVAIPCSGHASLISGELKTIKGVKGVEFNLPNLFNVYYDSSKTSRKEILNLKVFNEYPAKVIEDNL